MIKHKRVIGLRVRHLIFFLLGGAVGFIAMPSENVALIFIVALVFYLLGEGFSFLIEYIEKTTPGA